MLKAILRIMMFGYYPNENKKIVYKVAHLKPKLFRRNYFNNNMAQIILHFLTVVAALVSKSFGFILSGHNNRGQF